MNYKYAETIVAKSLEEHGWKIQCRNYRRYRTELDIIASHKNTIAFIEVKSRCFYPGGELKVDNLFSLTKRKALIRGARSYVTENKSNFAIMRFDLAIIIFTKKPILTSTENRTFSLRYFSNIFEYS